MSNCAVTMAEIKEFGSFSPGAQRYIRRSLDIAFERTSYIAETWGRDDFEIQQIELQIKYYETLPALRIAVPGSHDLNNLPYFIGPLAKISSFDLNCGKIDTFSSYRFLYERLLGGEVRPWLPAGFCAAAAMPVLLPERRKKLLTSISEAAATAPGWSSREPTFFPEWIDKVETP